MIIPQKHENKPIIAIAESGFANCANITSVIIPNTVTEIGSSAFKNCAALARVDIPLGVEVIESGVFLDCASLKHVVIPDTVARIKNRAFENCKMLADVVLPTELKEIGGAFDGCDSIGSVHIPAATEVLSGNFSSCTGVTVDENNPVYKSDGNCIIRKSDNVLVAGCSNSVIPDYVEAIGNNAFSKCKITDIVIPDSVKEIGGRAFSYSVAERVVLPDGITVVSDYLFSHSTLVSVVISESVTTIGMRAFENCESLTGVTIPKGVVKIGELAFSECKSLESVVFSEGLTSFGNPPSSMSKLKKCSNIFQNCVALDNVVFPSTLEVLDPTAFRGCKSLTTLSVAEGNPYFRSENNCIISRTDNRLVFGCMGSVIPDNITCIGEYAFYGCPMESIKLPNGLEKIPEGAFCDCPNLRYVDIPDSVTYIGDLAFGFFDIRHSGHPIHGIPIRRGSITLSPNVTTVGGGAFAGFSVYTQVGMRQSPENYKPQSEYVTTLAWTSQAANIAYDCEILCENNVTYVDSINILDLIGINYGIKYIDLPVRNGYTFTGWATEKGGDAVYTPVLFMPDVSDQTCEFYVDFDEPFYVAFTQDMYTAAKAAGHTTLYAVWQSI